jgi:hypothetical protein
MLELSQNQMLLSCVPLLVARFEPHRRQGFKARPECSADASVAARSQTDTPPRVGISDNSTTFQKK